MKKKTITNVLLMNANNTSIINLILKLTKIIALKKKTNKLIKLNKNFIEFEFFFLVLIFTPENFL